MQKLSTGVYGLNKLIGGGINLNSTTVLIGGSGAGKTTFALQFLRRGLELGEDGIFITLDEAPKQLLRKAISMGWTDAEKHLEQGSFIFVDAGGKQFKDFIKHELANFVRDWEGHKARIVIDPLTPVMWSVQEKYEQRDIVSFLLRSTRKIGTVLCTLEEHGVLGDLSTPEIAIPMYLADNVVHLRYASTENPESRELKIVKSRMSPHSKFSHPYNISPGVGMVVKRVDENEKDDFKGEDVEAVFKKMLRELPKGRFQGLKSTERKNISRTVKAMAQGDKNEDPKEVLELIFQEYGLL